MPRPIYRWKSLWLGILILSFLGWAWVRSMEKPLIWIPWDQCRMALRSSGGELDLLLMPSSAPRLGSGIIHFNPDRYSFLWFPEPIKSYSSLGGDGISVAYWLAILLFFNLWFILLLLRWWRIRIRCRANVLPDS